MKTKVKTLVANATDRLNKGIEADDVKAIASALRFLNGVGQAYLGYLSVVNYEEPYETVGVDA